MFGAAYSRTKFWVVTILTFIIGSFINLFVNMSSNEDANIVFLLVFTAILINSLANRIRDYESNPWLSLWALVPLVGAVQALYFGIKHKKSKDNLNNTSYSEEDSKQPLNDEPKEQVLKRYSYKEESTEGENHNASYSETKPSKPLKRLN
jgi:hypothetical protein